MVIVNKRIPIPTQQRNTQKYPFRTLNVGQSIIVPTRSGVQCAYQLAARDTSYKFTSEKCEEGWVVTRV